MIKQYIESRDFGWLYDYLTENKEAKIYCKIDGQCGHYQYYATCPSFKNKQEFIELNTYDPDDGYGINDIIFFKPISKKELTESQIIESEKISKQIQEYKQR